MPEIASTALGRNAILAGLLSHAAAVLAATLSASGAEPFWGIVFPFSCLVLAIGAYGELTHRGYTPLRDWRFYAIAALTVFPLLGPLMALGLLYHLQKSGQTSPVGIAGLFPALFRLKANALVLFALLLALFLLFAVIHSRHDPYFKRRASDGPTPQSLSAAGPQANAVGQGPLSAPRTAGCPSRS
jgi:hypothetical protein